MPTQPLICASVLAKQAGKACSCGRRRPTGWTFRTGPKRPGTWDVEAPRIGIGKEGVYVWWPGGGPAVSPLHWKNPEWVAPEAGPGKRQRSVLPARNELGHCIAVEEYGGYWCLAATGM